jgi:branched-chain amino acid transport system substrate-binding protein
MRTKQRRWPHVAGALCATAAIAFVAGCGGTDDAGGSGGGDEKGPIKIGSVLDVTGVQNVEGKAMYDATKLAIEDINSSGGILGRKLELKFYDAQSDQSKYAQYANQLALKDKPDVAMAGISSASREAIRPVFGRNKILYFYNELYEGGVCDKNTFATGVVPSQSLAALIPWAVEKYGKRVYVIGADYNFGQISANWAADYVKQAGGTVVGKSFIPLESSNFGSVVDDIQRLKPDVVYSALVGTNHVAFYRAYAAAGLADDMNIVSSTFGLSNENGILQPSETKGINVAYPYIQTLETPENKAFLEKWAAKYGKDHAALPDSAVAVWNGLHLWAKGVEKAGTTDRDAVIEALESGISIDSPSGKVTLDGKSHHVLQSVSIAETDGKRGFKIVDTKNDVAPKFEQQACDLQGKPATNKQFTP